MGLGAPRPDDQGNDYGQRPGGYSSRCATSWAKIQRPAAQSRRQVRQAALLCQRQRRRIGCCYQPFIHDAAQIDARILAGGFRRTYEARTAGWLTRVYARVGG